MWGSLLLCTFLLGYFGYANPLRTKRSGSMQNVISKIQTNSVQEDFRRKNNGKNKQEIILDNHYDYAVIYACIHS
jgi:hypothetical protein